MTDRGNTPIAPPPVRPASQQPDGRRPWHPRIDQLAGLALGQPADDQVSRHAETCPKCRGKMRRLRAAAEAKDALAQATLPERVAYQRGQILPEAPRGEPTPAPVFLLLHFAPTVAVRARGDRMDSNSDRRGGDAETALWWTTWGEDCGIIIDLQSAVLRAGVRLTIAIEAERESPTVGHEHAVFEREMVLEQVGGRVEGSVVLPPSEVVGFAPVRAVVRVSETSHHG
jgi:hypothetical protein